MAPRHLHIFVPAATGDEAAYLRSSDQEDAESANSEDDTPEGEQDGARAQNQNEWKGDRPESAYCPITWRETRDAEEVTQPALILWSSELLLNSGRGVTGPFFTHQTAAKAWSFSTALSTARSLSLRRQQGGWAARRR